jgi:hypothetical protein
MRCNRALRDVVLVAAALILGSCGGSSVAGNTYEAAGGAVSIAFQSAGKAVFAMGPLSSPCTYAENERKISVTCQGDTTDFTLNDDGSLSGPPNGLVGRLTKKKT